MRSLKCGRPEAILSGRSYLKGCGLRKLPSEHERIAAQAFFRAGGSHASVGPPGLNEPHVNIVGTVAACLCFAWTGKVTKVNILSGPAMMQQSVLESVKDWTFRPVK